MSGLAIGGPIGGLRNDRGAVQYSTTYAPGDVILYYGERILATSTFTTSSGTNGSGQPFISAANYIKLTSLGWFWASDYGVRADGSTDDWTALQTLLLLIRSLTTNSSNGYRAILPSGQVMLSKPLICPTQTMLVGQGFYSTVLKILASANCDVVQPEMFNSSAQASILSSISGAPSQGNLRNAFRWGLRDLCVHGNSTNQSATGYYHGVNAQTNPLTSTGTGDPDFDPQAICSNVQFRSCTGDGFYANGRSGMRLESCVSWHNNGNGFTPSFDTQMTACQAAFNGVAGFYLNHQSNQGASNKSYNNGNAFWWTTGTTYAAGSYAATATGLYYTAAGVVSSAVTPASDPGNWTAVSGSTGGATSPQAWGIGVYVDSNAGEITMQCDCQQNSAGSWYARSTIGAVNLVGTSSQPNFGGSNQNTSTNNSTNPNSYAHLTLDNASGVVATLGVNLVNAATYALRVINGSTNNDVRLAGDTSATFLSPDSSTLLGSTNHVVYNGQNKTVAQSVFSNLFGDGSHGAAVLDGVATVPWATLVGSTYTMNRDAFCTSLTINSGKILIPSGYKIFCTGTLTNNGTIRADGTSATSFAGGANAAGGSYYTFDLGGTGGAGNTGAGSVGGSGGISVNAGAGGLGSSGAGGGAGQGFSPTYGWPREAQGVLAGVFNAAGTVTAHKGGAGGGGGGGDGSNRGGGGGAGASSIVIFATAVVNTGAISAVGGAGFTPTLGNCGGGGGGAGGQVWLYTLSAWTNSGTTTVTGGAAGTGVGTGATGGAGTIGTVTNYVLV